METIYETPVLTAQGVIQSVRYYDYDKGQVTIKRTFNGKEVASETFYLD